MSKRKDKLVRGSRGVNLTILLELFILICTRPPAINKEIGSVATILQIPAVVSMLLCATLSIKGSQLLFITFKIRTVERSGL